jgi:sulfonate transport system substrate-binding protein
VSSERAPLAANTRRYLGGVAVLLALVASSCAAKSSKAETSRITFGAGKVDLGTVTLQVGDQNQLLRTVFAASGEQQRLQYKVAFNQFTDGPHMNAAFSANRLDVGYMGDTPVLFANAAKAGVSVLSAGVLGGGATAYQLLAAPGSGIRSIADLKGKKVGFTKRTALEGWIINLLKTANLTERDLTAVDLPILSLVGALSSGQLDAVVGTPPGAQTYVRQHPESVVTVPTQPVYLVIVGKTNALADASKLAALEDFVGRLARAEAWVRSHREAFVQQYYVETLQVPAAIGNQLYDLNGSIEVKPVSKTGLRASLEAQHRSFVALGELRAAPPVSDLFSDEVVSRFDAAVTSALKGTAS